MRAFTHLAAGALVGQGFAHMSGATPGLALAGGLLGALLPDIDHPQSWLGRRLPFVSIPLSMLIGHRGATHSLLALLAALAGALASTASGGPWAAFLGALCAGYASHLAADWLTPAGIPLYWPNPRRHACRLPVRIGGVGEYILAALLWLGAWGI